MASKSLWQSLTNFLASLHSFISCQSRVGQSWEHQIFWKVQTTLNLFKKQIAYSKHCIAKTIDNRFVLDVTLSYREVCSLLNLGNMWFHFLQANFERFFDNFVPISLLHLIIEILQSSFLVDVAIFNEIQSFENLFFYFLSWLRLVNSEMKMLINALSSYTILQIFSNEVQLWKLSNDFICDFHVNELGKLAAILKTNLSYLSTQGLIKNNKVCFILHNT